MRDIKMLQKIVIHFFQESYTKKTEFLQNCFYSYKSFNILKISNIFIFLIIIFNIF